MWETIRLALIFAVCSAIGAGIGTTLSAHGPKKRIRRMERTVSEILDLVSGTLRLVANESAGVHARFSSGWTIQREGNGGNPGDGEHVAPGIRESGNRIRHSVHDGLGISSEGIGGGGK